MPQAARSLPAALAERQASRRQRGHTSLSRRYAGHLAILLSTVLLASAAVGAYSSYRDTRALIDELQREKARAAAARIEEYLRGVERQMRGAAISARSGDASGIDAYHAALLRLLQSTPAIGDAAWLDAKGRELVRVSRIAADVLGSRADRSAHPAFAATRDGRAWHGDVFFHRGSEPHFELAVGGDRNGDGTIIADLNLKFAADVVAAIRLGEHGFAYAVDRTGRLILHPDPSAMLRKSDLAQHPQVRAALLPGSGLRTVVVRSDPAWTIAAFASVEPTAWQVIVEQPVTEAFAPMIVSALRILVFVLVGILLAGAASLVFARRLTAPIRLLERGAQRIGEGHLDERVEVRTGDELEKLADQFNRMATQLQESYADLEQKVRDRTQQLEDANRAKARFLAAASHDLRQPVHALGLFIAQLEEACDEESRQRLLTRVAASSTAVAELLDGLLDISKLDAGAVVPRPTAFALQPLLDRVEHAFSPAAARKGLRLRVRPTRLRIHTDPLLLERIVMNLCANAVRYTPQGGVIVAARRCAGRIRIEVRDTGIGIEPDQRRHIFEEFYQVSAAGNLAAPGLGLGLAIVKRLCTLLALPLHVHSIPARGSTFAIEVEAAAAESRIASAPLTSAARFDAVPVLVIDDDALAREATAGLLQQWGCEARAAASASEALRLLTQRPTPLLIICDYHLRNEVLGTHLVRQMRSAAGKEIAAVLLTADASPTLGTEAAANNLHLLHKPLNAARLRSLLLHVVGDVGSAQP